ncbi:hypothetical protein ACHQM5_028242 [Ranunculus cassubicifolius]
MTLSLLISFIFFTLTFTFFTTPLLANHENVLRYWKSSYPNIPIPSVISQSISKMKPNDIDMVVSLIKKQALSSNLPYFCETASLVCFHNVATKCIGYYDSGPTKPPATKTPSHDMSPLPQNNKLYLPANNKLYRGIFFRESVLKNGAKFDMGNLEVDLSPAKAFLPYPIASLLTPKQAQVLFSKTDIAHMMDNTISMCNSFMPGETRKCVSSVREIVNFPAEIFRDRRLKMLNPKSNAGSQKTVLLKNIRPVLRENPKAKFVSCHEVFFPYKLMYCHATSSVQVYEADLVHPETQEMVNDGMFAVCHRDTSHWDPKHVSFSELKVGPGETEVCHWISTANLAWVHLDDTIPS